MPNGTTRFSGYLEPEEVRSIINAIPQVSKHPERDQLLAELLWQSGARVTEAITLVPERIGMTSVILINLKQSKPLKGPDGKVLRDENQRPVRVKDENAIKEVEISQDLCQRLKDFCVNISIGEWIFQNKNPLQHVSRWYIWDLITRASEQARIFRFGKRHIRTGGRFKGAFPHLFRHSSAMYMLEETDNIMIVQQQLGHADVKTTQSYAYVKKKQVKKAISKIKW